MAQIVPQPGKNCRCSKELGDDRPGDLSLCKSFDDERQRQDNQARRKPAAVVPARLVA
jgi:hypothetical protein